MLKPVPLTVLLALRVVNAPVLAVVAPTVPLMLKLVAVPVMFVPTSALGVPSAGVTSVGLVARTLLPVPVLVTLTTFLLASSAKAVEAVRPDKVVVPLALSVVNAPAAGVVPPIEIPLSDAVDVRARPVADSTTTWLADPLAKVGSLSKPAVTRSNSLRMVADVAADPVDGNDPCV